MSVASLPLGSSASSERPLRFDPTDLAFIENPYPTLNALREAAPVFYVEEQARWILTRYHDIRAALRDRRLGRNFDHVMTHAEVGISPPEPHLAPFYEVERYSLLWLEPPAHTRIRTLISQAFTPRRVTAMRPRMVELAGSLLEKAQARGRFDLLHDYAAPYSLHVIAELLGAPTGDSRLLLDWSHAIVKMYELAPSPGDVERALAACRAFSAWSRDLITERRRAPRTDLISALIAAESDGGRLGDDEIISTIIVLLNAGHEATVNTIGNGMRALFLHQAEWDRLIRGEVLPSVAIEEMIRWDAPLQLFERWVLEDGVVIAGQPIARGQKLAMLFGAANRDPRYVAAPDIFDVGRGDTAHVTFGGGIHHCIGAALARLELEVALSCLVQRAPTLTLAAEPTRQPTFVIRGLAGLPVSWS